MKLDYALSDIHIFDYIPPTKSDSALSDVPNYYLENIPLTKIKHMMDINGMFDTSIHHF